MLDSNNNKARLRLKHIAFVFIRSSICYLEKRYGRNINGLSLVSTLSSHGIPANVDWIVSTGEILSELQDNCNY